MLIQYSNTDAHFPSLHQFNMTENNNVNMETSTVLKKGLLWQHKDKLFSRWKERYFVLTKDYLSCFKKATKIAHSDMGGFIFKLSLVHMEGLRWLNSTQNSKENDVIVLEIPKRQGPNILLKGDDLMDWFIILQKTIGISKERREELRASTSSLPRGLILKSNLGEGKLVISPHLYALQHTFSDSKLFTKLNKKDDTNTPVRNNLKNVSDHKRTPQLYKRNRVSIFSELDIENDKKLPSDNDVDLGIDLEIPSPASTLVQTKDRKSNLQISNNNHRALVKSYSHVLQPSNPDYLCTSSPTMSKKIQRKSDVYFTGSTGSSSSQYWGRESPVLSQGSAYAKHVLSSPITDSRRSKKYSSFIESPGRMKKSKQGAKSATEEFSFVQPVSSKRRARTLPDNRHIHRSLTPEPASVHSQRFSVYYDQSSHPSQNLKKIDKNLSHPRHMSYGLLRFIDSSSPSPEL